jgi:hypothetical protein
VRPKITIYVTDQELAELRREASCRRLSISRYAKERLLPRDLEQQTANGDYSPRSHEAEKRLVEAVRGTVAGGNRSVLDQLSTLIVMLDQFAFSALMHLGEIPEAQKERARAAAERRHGEWQRRVEELLRELRGAASEEKQIAAGNGAHA